jgi:hypothetical protein
MFLVDCLVLSVFVKVIIREASRRTQEVQSWRTRLYSGEGPSYVPPTSEFHSPSAKVVLWSLVLCSLLLLDVLDSKGGISVCRLKLPQSVLSSILRAKFLTVYCSTSLKKLVDRWRYMALICVMPYHYRLILMIAQVLNILCCRVVCAASWVSPHRITYKRMIRYVISLYSASTSTIYSSNMERTGSTSRVY